MHPLAIKPCVCVCGISKLNYNAKHRRHPHFIFQALPVQSQNQQLIKRVPLLHRVKPPDLFPLRRTTSCGCPWSRAGPAATGISHSSKGFLLRIPNDSANLHVLLYEMLEWLPLFPQGASTSALKQKPFVLKVRCLPGQLTGCKAWLLDSSRVLRSTESTAGQNQGSLSPALEISTQKCLTGVL